VYNHFSYVCSNNFVNRLHTGHVVNLFVNIIFMSGLYFYFFFNLLSFQIVITVTKELLFFFLNIFMKVFFYYFHISAPRFQCAQLKVTKNSRNLFLFVHLLPILPSKLSTKGRANYSEYIHYLYFLQNGAQVFCVSNKIIAQEIEKNGRN